MVKCIPLSNKHINDYRDFFLNILPKRDPPNMFISHGPHIAKDTPGSTPLILSFNGKIIIHAKLQDDWGGLNNDKKSDKVYLLKEIELCNNSLSLNQLPKEWQQHWKKGRFDQYIRKLDDVFYNEFLCIARST